MDGKKAQGISINFIVIAAIAALVLVIIIAFTTGSFGDLFKQIKTTSQTELDTAKSTCANYCNTAEGTLTRASSWETTSYCTKTFAIDSDGDGELSDDEFAFSCWEAPILVDCSFRVGDYVARVKDGACTTELASSTGTTTPVCGDGITEDPEECETDAECTGTNEVCTDCVCVTASTGI